MAFLLKLRSLSHEQMRNGTLAQDVYARHSSGIHRGLAGSFASDVPASRHVPAVTALPRSSPPGPRKKGGPFGQIWLVAEAVPHEDLGPGCVSWPELQRVGGLQCPQNSFLALRIIEADATGGERFYVRHPHDIAAEGRVGSQVVSHNEEHIHPLGWLGLCGHGVRRLQRHTRHRRQGSYGAEQSPFELAPMVTLDPLYDMNISKVPAALTAHSLHEVVRQKERGAARTGYI